MKQGVEGLFVAHMEALDTPINDMLSVRVCSVFFYSEKYIFAELILKNYLKSKLRN